MPPPTKARNPSNQGILDYLTTLSQHEKFNKPSSYYPYIFQRALKSIALETTAITTYEQAKKLKNIGTFLASQIAKFYEQQELPKQQQQQQTPEDEQQQQQQKPTQSKKRSADAVKKSSAKTCKQSKRSDSLDECDDVDGNVNGNNNLDTIGIIPTPAQATELLKRTTKQMNGATKVASSSLTPSEISLSKAVRFSNYLSSSTTGSASNSTTTTILSENYTNFTLVLLMDAREHKSDQVQSRLLQQGIYCEQRTLPIGDMLWIARGYNKHTLDDKAKKAKSEPSARSRVVADEPSLPETVEIVLDTIIERKTLEDLISSLYGTRWNEQRLRLKQHTANAATSSGAETKQQYQQPPQVIYLIESSSTLQQDSRKSVHSSNNNTVSSWQAQQHQTVQSCIFHTMIQLGFGIIRTRNLDDTISWLRRIHARLLKRYFGNNNESKNASNKSRCLTTSSTRHPSFSHPPTMSRNGLLLYDEYKANIELTRERGTKTVSRIFAAQLKQIPGMSVKRVNAITTMYPTPKSLFDAYNSCSTADTMVENIPINVSIAECGGQNQRKKQSRLIRVGPKCSLELSNVFCSLPHDSTSSSNRVNKVTNNTANDEDTTTACSVKNITSKKSNDTKHTPTLLHIAASSTARDINLLNSPDNASYNATDFISSMLTLSSPSMKKEKASLQQCSDSKITNAKTAVTNEPLPLVKKQAIETLTAMGFDHESVVLVLEEHDHYHYDVEAAANFLLGG